MKKQWISLAAGIAIGGLVFGSVGVSFADSVTKAINATYKNIKLVIDGETFTPKDPNGNIVEPFIYNGTTYLPIRAIGEAFGKQVNWDGTVNTVYIGEMPAKAAKEVFLFDQPYTSCSDPSGFKNFEKDGKNFVGFWNTPSDDVNMKKLENGRYQGTFSVTYPLNGNAAKVRGTFATPTFAQYAPTYTFRFYDESGRTLFESPIINENTAPIDFEFDVEGVLSLKIETTLEGDWDNLSKATQYMQNLRVMTTEY